MRMQTFRPPWDAETVILECPGCLSWQVDYTTRVAGSYAQVEVMGTMSFAGDHDEAYTRFDMSPFYEAVEAILEEHLVECVHLRKLLGTEAV